MPTVARTPTPIRIPADHLCRGLHRGATSTAFAGCRWSGREPKAGTRTQEDQARLPVSVAAFAADTAHGAWKARHAASGPTTDARRVRSSRAHLPCKDHPKNVYLPEAAVLGPLNEWLGELFAPEHIDQTVAALVASQHQGYGSANHARDAAKRRLDTAETRLRRLQAAIEAGAVPTAFVEAINEAQSQRAAARGELDGTPAPDALTDAEVYAMIDSLGNVWEALNEAKPEDVEKLYEARLELMYYAP